MQLPSRLLILGTGDLAVGLTLLMQNEQRTSSRAYAGVKTVASVETWGLVLTIIGALLLAGVVLHGRVTPAISKPIEALLATLAVTWASYWAIELAVTAATDSRVSFAGAELWFLYVVVPHVFLAFGREG